MDGGNEGARYVPLSDYSSILLYPHVTSINAPKTPAAREFELHIQMIRTEFSETQGRREGNC
jgi:hypothetical protein